MPQPTQIGSLSSLTSYESLYSPLVQSEDEIRLLQVDLSVERRHKLISNVALRSKRQLYTALSYPWGSTQRDKLLNINGFDVQVSQNLKTALDNVIRFWLQTYGTNGRTLLLWCDQICINQYDHDEKGHQVGYMSKIYRKAELVLVWLPVRSGTSQGFDSWAQWRDWHLAQVNPEYAHVSDMVYAHQALERNVRAAWWSVQEIVTSPSWRRVWMYQEFMLATRAIFLIDGVAAPRTGLQEVLEHFYSISDHHSLLTNDAISMAKDDAARLDLESQKQFDLVADEREKSWQTDWIDSLCGPFWACFCCCCIAYCGVPFHPIGSSTWARKRKLKRYENLAAERAERTLQSQHQILDLTGHVEMLRQAELAWSVVNFVLRAKVDMADHEFVPLSQLIKHGRNCDCSDPRDKVFAFLGLTDPAYELHANYDVSRTTNDVLIDATIAVIRTEKSLGILNDAKEDECVSSVHDHLPSWVPNFTVPDSSNRDYQRFIRGIRLPATGNSASRDRVPEVTFSTDRNGNRDRVMKARGIRVCRLARTVKDDENEPWRLYATDVEGLEVGTRSTSRIGDEVWVLFGAEVPYTLSRPSKRDDTYEIVGQAMLWEGEAVSSIMKGSLIYSLEEGLLEDEVVAIV